jgi:hypothetical protein
MGVELTQDTATREEVEHWVAYDRRHAAWGAARQAAGEASLERCGGPG